MGRSSKSNAHPFRLLFTVFLYHCGFVIYKCVFVKGFISGDTSYFAYYCPLDRSIPTRYTVYPLENLFNEVSYIQISSQTTANGGPIAWIGSDGAQESIQAVDLTTGGILRQYKLNIPIEGDWESVGMGPCNAKRHSPTCLYFGNVGNNDAHDCRDRSCLLGRATATIYKLEEPDLSQPVTSKLLTVASIIVDYNHPGMPTIRADSETLFVDPVGDEEGGKPGDLYLITKFPSAPHLQRLVKVPNDHKAMNLQSGETRRFSVIPMGTPFSASGQNVWTGGDISENGALISLTDGKQLHFFPRPPHISIAEAMARPSCVYRSNAEIGGVAKQYETVSFHKGSVAETSECRGKKACTLSINEYELLFSSPEPRLVLPDTTFAPTMSPPPTSTPTASPTRTPTENPTRFPTQSPTAQPSASPSNTPTSRPSVSPSNAPTVTPSASPTLSMIPTGVPSSQPSCVPSSIPSTTPSVPPSAIPTSSPSAVPSDSPSNIPSSQPSSIPSSIPTTRPSDAPSNVPTISISPSAIPTKSSMPSAAPTVSAQPSCIPSQIPSASPSESPQPSRAPYEPYFGRLPRRNPVKRVFSLEIELQLLFHVRHKKSSFVPELKDSDRLILLESIESHLRSWYSKDLNMAANQYEMDLSEKEVTEKRKLEIVHTDHLLKGSATFAVLGTFTTYETRLTKEILTASTWNAFDSYADSKLSTIIRMKVGGILQKDNPLVHLKDVVATSVSIQESAHIVKIGAKSPALVALGYGLLSFALVGFCASVGYLLNERGQNDRDHNVPSTRILDQDKEAML